MADPPGLNAERPCAEAERPEVVEPKWLVTAEEEDEEEEHSAS